MTEQAGPSALRLLLVEDNPDDADLVERTLALVAREARTERARVTRAGCLADAIALLGRERFHAVLLDLGLPDAQGIESVERLRAVERHVALVVLTGLPDRDLALRALQAGAQDYLVKGEVTPGLLERSLRYALERARIAHAERELLEKTLKGSIKALSGVLALASPAAFGRAMRLKRYVGDLAQQLGVEESWPVEVAALVSQIGCVTLPPGTCEKHYRGDTLTATERAAVEGLPKVAAGLLADIPRLEEVRAILLHQRRGPAGEPPPRAAELLRVAAEYDELETKLGSAHAALRALAGRTGAHSAEVVQAFVESRTQALADEEELSPVSELLLGMVLAQDVVTSKGRLLIARGHEITELLLERLRGYDAAGEFTEPIRVLRAGGPEPEGMR